MDEPRLKIALQKSGRLTEPSVDLLVRCGLKLSRGKDQLIGFGANMPLDVLFVRDDDIRTGCRKRLDLAPVFLIVREIISGPPPGQAGAFPSVARRIERCSLRSQCRELAPDRPRVAARRRIATTYPYLLERYLREHDAARRM